jgi:hypothetical protein
VFIIDSSRVVRYAAVDEVVSRVPAGEIVSRLQCPAKTQPLQRRVYVPLFVEWRSAIRNMIQR